MMLNAYVYKVTSILPRMIYHTEHAVTCHMVWDYWDGIVVWDNGIALLLARFGTFGIVDLA